MQRFDFSLSPEKEGFWPNVTLKIAYHAKLCKEKLIQRTGTGADESILNNSACFQPATLAKKGFFS